MFGLKSTPTLRDGSIIAVYIFRVLPSRSLQVGPEISRTVAKSDTRDKILSVPKISTLGILVSRM
jgi:hypothetical protein